MRPLHAFRKTLAILGIGLATAVGLSLLPENSYQRWQLLEGTIHARTRWIYERIHFDPEPVDVVFIGPSRVEAGVDAPRISQALGARGLPANVVNFSLPEGGRNINLAIFAELLKTKQPKLLVIGVIEKPSRFGHPAYKYMAPREMLAKPGDLATNSMPFRACCLCLSVSGPINSTFSMALRHIIPSSTLSRQAAGVLVLPIFSCASPTSPLE